MEETTIIDKETTQETVEETEGLHQYLKCLTNINS